MFTLETTVPDTITSWVLSAFAVSPETGLGIASSTAKVGCQICVYSSSYLLLIHLILMLKIIRPSEPVSGQSIEQEVGQRWIVS